MRLAALAALVAILAYWSWLTLSGAIGYTALRDDPAAMDGQPVMLTLVAVGESLGPDRYVVWQGAQRVEVIGPSAEVRPGEDVTLGGVFSASEGAIRLGWVEHAPGRGAKKALGLLSLAFLAVAGPLWFRRAGRGLAIRG